jgi:thiol:disulfide interchange protein DsbD
MKHFRALPCLLLCLFFLGLAQAQAPGETPVRWTARSLKPVQAGGQFEAAIEATIAGDWHLYSTTQPPGGPSPTRFSLISEGPFQISGSIRQSDPESDFDPNFSIRTEFYTVGADFWVPIKVAPEAKPGDYDLRIQVVYQVCNERVCLPPTRVPIAVKLKIIAGSAAAAKALPAPGTGQGARAVSPPVPAGKSQTKEPPPVSSTTSVPRAVQSRDTPAGIMPARALAGTAAEVQEARTSGFLPFLWLAMTMGAISLATPCVFPMIPITVSYFTKNAESGRSAGVRQALIYCFGIIFTFTGLGLGLAALLGATGINQFAANPWVNLAITAIFVGFALNLFGLYQIGVPSGILTKLSSTGEARGSIQTLLMGLTFTLTSFTCTVPFVGTVLVATAQGDWLWPALGMLGFSTVFAAPFFLLALVPKFLTALPRSGGWLNSVKVTMGFLELAAAMKFISNVDLVWNWRIFSREVVLAVWLAIAILATLYLLGKFQLPHDTRLEHLGVMRMMSAMLFLAIGFYLFTGLIGGSIGELDAFLPPRTSGVLGLTGGGGRGSELKWHTALEPALADARAQRKPVFIDFTGYTCTNCRWMEANIFPLAAVHTELEKYVRVQLYTDGVGQQYEDNQKYQKERFGTVALPLYAILDSEGNKIATFPGMTRKQEEFLDFLRTPLQLTTNQ